MRYDFHNKNYDAPKRKGYIHFGNSSERDADEVLRKSGNEDGMIAIPFYPDGPLDGSRLDEFKIKWAIYRLDKKGTSSDF